MESNEFGLWIIDEEELDSEERKNLPWYEEDEDSMPRREEEPVNWHATLDSDCRILSETQLAQRR